MRSGKLVTVLVAAGALGARMVVASSKEEAQEVRDTLAEHPELAGVEVVTLENVPEEVEARERMVYGEDYRRSMDVILRAPERLRAPYTISLRRNRPGAHITSPRRGKGGKW